MADQYGNPVPKVFISLPEWSDLAKDLKLFLAVMECRWYMHGGDVYVTPGALSAYGVDQEWIDSQNKLELEGAMVVPETLRKRMMSE